MFNRILRVVDFSYEDEIMRSHCRIVATELEYQEVFNPRNAIQVYTVNTVYVGSFHAQDATEVHNSARR
tara:strand:+ start:2696 stop:2902 length:207 start_codon:yes stop_codon:yes gene_type:complete